VRKAAVVTGSLFVCGLVCMGYGRYGPWYVTEPLRSSLEIYADEAQAFPFSVAKSDEYYIEVYLRDEIPQETLEEIVGSYLRGGGGRLNLDWRVTSGERTVAKGSTREFGYSPIFKQGYTGLAAGKFVAEKNTQYSLLAIVAGGDPAWKPYKAEVRIELHPSKLEYLILFSVLGYVLIFVSFIGGAVIIASIAVGRGETVQ